MSQQPPSPDPSRRNFLDILLGLGILAWLGSLIYPVIRYLKPLPAQGLTGPTRLTRDEIGKLEADGFVIVPAGSNRVIVFTDESDNLRALSAKCTHEGCTVRYVRGKELIWCACHNGRFSLDGRVIAGPPPRPLPPWEVHRDEKGGVLIKPEVS